jgi:DNA-binding beta-propeller fold protein YncE
LKRRKLITKLVWIVILLAVLAFVGIWYLNFQATKKLTFDFVTASGDVLTAPQYLYSFAGTAQTHMNEPLGVFALPDRVFVTDARRGEIFQFTPAGQLVKVFGKGKLKTPLYIARQPKTGNLYVSDRGTRSVHIFSPDGAYLGVFDPKLPKDQLPKFEAKGYQWIPIALAFAPDGTLYATEILNGHRLLIFAPDGKFVKSVGTAGIAYKSQDLTNLFQFPNSVKVLGNEVWVVDSNNRRIKIYDRAGTFKRLIATQGLPRGLAFLPRPSDAPTNTTDKAVVVDTLSHDSTIWSSKGEKLLSFGAQGALEGQFQYPIDVSVGAKSLIFITDSQNIRVQVWGWPEKIAPVPALRIPQRWGWCLTPLLLLLLLLRRKRRFFATRDFVDAMVEAGQVHTMPASRRIWIVTAEDYESLKDIVAEEISLGELLIVTEHSESDAVALAERLDIPHDQAVVLSIAQRSKLFCTEDVELRRIAKLLEVDVVNHDEFVERFGKDADPAATDDE